MRIGIIGAGQLGRMLALAGYPFGLRFVFVDADEDAPGAQVGRIIHGRFDDPAALAALAASVDVVTFDVENVPEAAAAAIAARVPFYPPPEALGAGQDRCVEKRLFRSLGIPTAPFEAVDSQQELVSAAQRIGLPAILKTRRLGYDGRGQRRIEAPSDLDGAYDALGGVPAILEGFVHFERELSLIGVRGRDGRTAYWPLSENVHVDGILRQSRAPWTDPGLQECAERHLAALLDRFSYVGVLTVEFFLADGTLLANEMAPRVHNSGHWTIEGAVTSQFENHVRAILGLPLGSTAPTGHAAMVNFIGRLPALADALQIEGAHYHDYGKTARPNRKLGHCTIVRPTPAERDAALDQLLRLG
ncbi:MAG TPA: 5-(carboxyamino)imidazole ribonucleotide synthase [Gammaproteobacteria bacterium]|nr:5-(carboxyamino)imidazole ribonucleotide synthase [Gammaproteobacteria bacterium]